MKPRIGRYSFPFSTYWLLLRVLAIVSLSEMVVMSLLPVLLPDVHPVLTSIADAGMLVAFSAPLLWWFIVRPIRSSAMAEHMRAANIVESSINGIITADKQGIVESLNPAAERLFSYSEEEALGKPLTLLLPERYRDAFEKGLERARSGAESRAVGKTIEVYGLRKDGSEFPSEISLSTWETHQGKVYAGVIRDITERKQSERQLHLLSTALGSAANAIVITDRDGSITWVNPAFTLLTGYSSEEVLAGCGKTHY